MQRRSEKRVKKETPFGLLLCQHIKSERDCVCDRDEMDGEQENISKHYVMHPHAYESESTCFLHSFYSTTHHSAYSFPLLLQTFYLSFEILSISKWQIRGDYS